MSFEFQHFVDSFTNCSVFSEYVLDDQQLHIIFAPSTNRSSTMQRILSIINPSREIDT